MSNKFSNYKELLKIIAKKLSKKDKKYIYRNLNKITNQFIEISSIIKNISYLFNNKKDKNQIQKEIMKMNFSKQESQTLIDTILLNNLKGGDKKKIKGFLEELNENIDIKDKMYGVNDDHSIFNIPRILTHYTINFPKVLFQFTSNFYQYLANLFTFDLNSNEDFNKPLDIVYFWLFIFASFPFYGYYANIILIIKSLLDKKMFLAIITMISTFISSLLFYHVADIGLLYKVFYSIDNYSYSRKNISKIRNPDQKTLN